MAAQASGSEVAAFSAGFPLRSRREQKPQIPQSRTICAAHCVLRIRVLRMQWSCGAHCSRKGFLSGRSRELGRNPEKI